MTEPPRFGAAAEVPRGTAAVGVAVVRGARGIRLASVSQRQPKVDLAYLEARGFTAKAGEAESMPSTGGRSVIAVGFGETSSLDAEVTRKAGAALVRAARSSKVAMGISGLTAGLGAAAVARALTEGAALAAYDFRAYRSERKPPERRLETMTIVSGQVSAASAGVRRGEVVARSVYFARDLVNEPAGSLGPGDFADRALQWAAARGVEVEVWDEERIADERLGGVIGVCAGSVHEPRFLRLSANGALVNRRGRRGERAASGIRARPRTVALVGKGVTFDSGGLSLKSAGGMETMKTDMSGAAAVVAAMSALGEMDIHVPVAGFVPLVENMPGGRAVKPGDVLRARNGKTIEVLNTDAEGRLILADALSLAAETRPAAVVDLATLTGACSIALGDRIAGLMGTDERLVSRIVEASRRSGEEVWHLPLPRGYRKHIDSDVADVKNVGAAGGNAGALTAGLFLEEFAGEGPWAHLDIAGPARSSSDEGYLRRGGTGFGVRLLLDLLSSWR